MYRPTSCVTQCCSLVPSSRLSLL
uniref:Uncharacterized protein n=1 Tax=Anguilla anguilla TaxID=7936 RepID=A0A0E9TEY6_ANGAN